MNMLQELKYFLGKTTVFHLVQELCLCAWQRRERRLSSRNISLIFEYITVTFNTLNVYGWTWVVVHTWLCVCVCVWSCVIVHIHTSKTDGSGPSSTHTSAMLTQAQSPGWPQQQNGIKNTYLGVSVNFGYLTKYHRLGSLDNKNLVLTVPEWKSRARCQQLWPPLRPLSLVCRQLPALCVLMWPFCLSLPCGYTSLGGVCLLLRAPVLMFGGPIIITSSN